MVRSKYCWCRAGETSRACQITFGRIIKPILIVGSESCTFASGEFLTAVPGQSRIENEGRERNVSIEIAIPTDGQLNAVSHSSLVTTYTHTSRYWFHCFI